MITHTIAYIFDNQLSQGFWLFIFINLFMFFMIRMCLIDIKQFDDGDKYYNKIKKILQIAFIFYIIYIINYGFLNTFIFTSMNGWGYPIIPVDQTTNYSRNLQILSIIGLTISIYILIYRDYKIIYKYNKNKLVNIKTKHISTKFYIIVLSTVSIIVIGLYNIKKYYIANEDKIITETLLCEYSYENCTWADYTKDLSNNESFLLYYIPWSATRDEVKKLAINKKAGDSILYVFIDAELVDETEHTLTYMYKMDIDPDKTIKLTYYFNDNDRFYKLSLSKPIYDIKFEQEQFMYKDNSGTGREIEYGNYVSFFDANKQLSDVIEAYVNSEPNAQTKFNLISQINSTEILKLINEQSMVLYTINGLPSLNSARSPLHSFYKEFYSINLIKKDNNSDQIILEKIFYNTISELR